MDLKLAIPLLIFALLLPASLSQTFSEIDIVVPAVSQTPQGAYFGVPVRLNVKMVDGGTGEIYVNTRPLTQMDMQGSARVAAMVAGDVTGKDVRKVNFLITLYANSSIIGGPSAGGAMAVAMTALLDGLELRKDIMMTGMITPDGAIGVVGGIPEKAEAAHLSGARYFLVPKGQSVSYNSTTYQDVNVTELAKERWNITVVEISNIHEAVTWFTGLTLPPIPYPSTPVAVESYQRMMRVQSEREIEEANQSLGRASHAFQSSSLDESTRSSLGDDLNTSRERLIAAEDAQNQSKYYVASSKAFQSKIFSRYVLNAALFYSTPEDNRSEFMDDLFANVSSQITSVGLLVNRTDALSITGLECLAAAQSRVDEAQEKLDDARYWHQLHWEEDSLFQASFAFERIHTALLWANMTEMSLGGPVPDQKDLRPMAEGLFVDASNLAAYADLLYSEVFGLPEGQAINFLTSFIPSYSFIDPYESLDRAQTGLDQEHWAMATFESLESEVRSGVAIEFINVLVLAEDDEEVDAMLLAMANGSRSEGRIAIEESRRIGVEPVLSVSRFEFSEDLLIMNDTSALGEAAFGFRYARSAARLSSPILDLYRPRLQVYLENGSLVAADLTLQGLATDPNGDELNLTLRMGNLTIRQSLMPGPFSIPFPLGGIRDGWHILDLNLSDGSLFDEASLNLTIDNHPPSIMVDLQNETVYAHPVSPEIAVEDLVDPAPVVAVGLDGLPFNLSQSIGEGEHLLVVMATDHAGWSNEVRFLFRIDMTPPKIEAIQPKDMGPLHPPVQAVWRVFDNLTHIRRSSLSVDSREWEAVDEVNATNATGGWESWFKVSLPMDDGPHTLRFRAADEVGNEAGTNISILVDGSPPELNVSGITDGKWYDSPVRIRFSVRDTVDSQPEIHAVLDGELYTGGLVGEGRHLFSLTATDGAGNEAEKKIGFVVDLRPPEIWTNATKRAYPRGIAIDYRVTDDLDPFPKAGAELDGTDYAGGRLAEGVHLLRITAVDRADNSRSTDFTVIIDLHPPHIEVSVRNGSWYAQPQIVNISVEDNMDPDPLSNTTLDSSNYVENAEVGEGAHNLSIESMDWAGNRASERLVFYVDLTPPVLNLSEPRENGTYGHWVTPDLRISDALDHNASARWTLDGGPYDPGRPIEDGTHHLSITGFDQANNTRVIEIDFVVDTRPPVINISVKEGGSYRNGFVPTINVSDAGSFTWTAFLDGRRYDVGSKVGPGLHTLLVKARDDAGNEGRQKVVFTVRKGLSMWMLGILIALVVAFLVGARRLRRRGYGGGLRSR